MKKITCVLIVMVLVAALVGCTNVDKNNTAATPSAAPIESVAPTAAATATAETTVMPELDSGRRQCSDRNTGRQCQCDGDSNTQ